MKGNIIYVLLSGILLIFVCPILFSQIEIEWKKSLDIGSDAESNGIVQTDDGGYIVLASSQKSGSHVDWLLKFDVDGNSVWSNTYSGGGYSNIEQTSEGGYIIGGGYYDTRLMKTNSQGVNLWTRSFSGGCLDIEQTSDGGYIIIGDRLLKLNATGDSIWSKNAVLMVGRSIQQTNDGGYIYIGEVLIDENGNIVDTWSHETDHTDILLIKTDSNGDTLWTRTYGGNKEDQGNHVQQTNDGGYIIAAGLTWDHWDFHYGYCIKIDSIGNTQWTFVDSLHSSENIYQMEDGGYLVFGGSDDDVYNCLTKIDINGNKIWTKIIDQETTGWYSHGQLTNDGDFILTGWFEKFLWIAKVGEQALSYNQEIIDRYISIQPNPTCDFLRINSERSDNYTIEVLTLNGQLLTTTRMDGTTHQLDLSTFQKGVYFITIRAKDYVTTRKIIKM
jgi:hypothetical protein